MKRLLATQKGEGRDQNSQDLGSAPANGRQQSDHETNTMEPSTAPLKPTKLLSMEVTHGEKAMASTLPTFRSHSNTEANVPKERNCLGKILTRLSPPTAETGATSNNRSDALATIKHKLRKFAKFIGPGFLVSVAYIDPGMLPKLGL
jgi:hypothetical protein